MNDQRVKYCATCFAPYHYERSTSKYCSDLCRVKDFQKKEDTKRREEYLNNLYKGSEVIDVEMIVEDAPENGIAADFDTPLTPGQENSIPLSVIVDEEPYNFNDKLNNKFPNRNRLLNPKEPFFMEKVINTLFEFCEAYNNTLK